MRKTFSGRSAARVGVVVSLLFTATEVVAQARSAEAFVWQGPVPAGGALEIKGVNGSIRAVAATGGGARVEATRTARRDDPSGVRIVVVEHAGGVTVCAVYPANGDRENECRPGSDGRIAARNSDVQVAFTVHVPPAVDFLARTTNGAVTAENLSGRVDALSTNGDIVIGGAANATARTTNGSVTIHSAGAVEARTTNGQIVAQLTGLTGSQPLSFSTTNGSITLRLPAGTNATLEASTSNGTIQTDFPITVQGAVNRRRLNGTLGTGGVPIQLRTTNGSIHLQRGS